jgi:hypothetical protein
MEDVIKATCFLDDPRDFMNFNRVFAEYFPTNPPTRTTVRAQLMMEGKVEIEVVAYRPLDEPHVIPLFPPDRVCAGDQGHCLRTLRTDPVRTAKRIRPFMTEVSLPIWHPLSRWHLRDVSMILQNG